MVKVPVAPQVQPQVQQEQVAAPQFQAAPSPGMQSAMQLGQDLARAGQMALGIQRDQDALELYEQRQQARAAKEKEAIVAARQDEIAKVMLKGAETVFTAQAGERSDTLKRSRGLSVLDDFGSAESDITDIAKRIEDTLPEQLRPKWRMQSQALFLPMRREMLDHVGKEVDKTARESSDKRIDNLGDMASRMSSSALDPSGDFAVFAGAAMNEIDDFVARDGYGPNSPQALERKRKWWTNVSESITGDMVDQARFDDAVKFAEGVNSAGMLPKERFDEIRKGIESAESVYSSTTTAQQLFDSGEDINTIIDFVRKADRPQDWIDNTIKRINALDGQRTEEQKRAYDDLYQEAQDRVWTPDAFRNGLPAMDRLPPSIAKQLKPGDLNKLYEMPLTDDQAAIDYVRQRIATSEGPGGAPFTMRDLQTYRGRMRPTTFDSFRRIMSDPQEIKKIVLSDDVFNVVAKEQGLQENLITPESDNDRAQKAAIRLQWEQSIRAYESGVDKNGRPLVADRDTMADLLSNILTTRMYDKNTILSGFSPVSGMAGVYAGAIVPKERSGRYLQLAPEGERVRYIEVGRYESVVRKLRDDGVEATPSNIVAGYNAMFGQMPSDSSAAGLGGGGFTGQGFPGSPSDRFGIRFVPERPPVAPQERPPVAPQEQPPAGPDSAMRSGLMPYWPFGPNKYWYSK